MTQSAGDIRIPISDVSKRMTLNIEVVGVKVWSMRLRLAVLIFRLGAMVAPIGVEIDYGKNDVQN